MSDPSISTETEQAMQGRSSRFTRWVAFLVFSTITPSSEAKWAVACSAVTFAVTALIVGAHLFPVASTLVVGTKLEGIVIVVLTAFWCATVIIVTNASYGLGVSEDASNQVLNGNLYYFTAIISSSLLCDILNSYCFEIQNK
jgi:uncharacterized membrane protein YjdF